MARRRSVIYSIAKEMERANKRAIAEQNRINSQIERQKKALERNKKALERQKSLLKKENAIKYAEKLTKEAEYERASVNSLLNNIYMRKSKFDWEKYKDNSKFKEILEITDVPLKPNEAEYKVKSSILSLLIPSRKRKEEEVLNKKLESDLQNWKYECKKIEEINNSRKDKWLDKKSKFEKQQKETNDQIDEMKKRFEQEDIEGIEFYFNEVLNNSSYPKYFDLDWEIEYNISNKMLVIEYEIPKKSDIINLKQVKYIQTRNEYSETYIKDSEINKIYEEGLYQLCLRINYDIYSMDDLGYVEGIVFNGYLTDVNKSNGIEETKCLISLQTEKSKFMDINLKNVDAKLCFKGLKGVAGAKLSDLVPVAPITTINTSDKRFVESREIGSEINGYNLASMHWEDFEYLIREVFEKEFSKEGAEVKITQASRDGGVDAIIFDPDPIKGGKYIIQAKRYTNIVGVSAVRDLYGTVMNEGASKGILVTTSDYGRDSHEFAKDKPITLLNGANLLHMLEKHGYEARIDLSEAKIQMNNIKNK
jgi:restriction system protein